MASHPYISGANNITKLFAYLRKTFPAVVTSETIKRYGLAPNNESYLINVLQFLNLIDEEGRRTELGHEVMTKHNDNEFQAAFKEVVKTAYSDLFEIRGDDAWVMSRDDLISYFRNSDKTSEIIGGRQALAFEVIRELALGQSESYNISKPRAEAMQPPKAKVKAAKAQLSGAQASAVPGSQSPPQLSPKGDIALTVRVEINLPSEGSQETYDAIFKSIKANLFP